MATYKLKNFKKILPELVQGEVIQAGAFAMPPGGMKRQMMGGAFGVIGQVVAAKGQGTAGSFELPRRFILGLTNQRLLFVKPDALLGRPKSILYAIPVNQIASAGLGDKGAMSQQAVFALKSGEQVIVEVGKVRVKAWMVDLLEKLQPMLTA